ncbi:MAG: DinB family protein [Blastocatellia bacterium]|nr:DinB family protein [Blastocatellia bacterium]
MKNIVFLALLLCPLFAFAQPVASKGSTTMSKEDRAKALKLLQDSHQETLDAIKGLSDEQWNYKPAPDKWSVGEVAEHIWLAESLLFGAMENALKAPENPNWEEQTKGKNERVVSILTNRTGKAQAPETIKPTGKTRAEILKGLAEVRAKTIQFATATQAAMNSHTLDHPFKVFGTLSAYQWLIYIPAHNLRHNQQILEVKAAPGFPRK